MLLTAGASAPPPSDTTLPDPDAEEAGKLEWLSFALISSSDSGRSSCPLELEEEGAEVVATSELNSDAKANAHSSLL